MGVLDIVSGLSKAAGQGYAGYGEDQQLKVKETLAAQKAKLDAENAAVLNKVRMAGIDPTVQGSIAGARATAEVPAKVEALKQTTPLEIVKAKGVAEAVAPVNVQTHKEEKIFDNANPAPVQQTFTPVVTTAPSGEQHVSSFGTKTGSVTDTGTQAKAAGSMAKLTGDQEKSYLFYNLMKNAEPEITRTLGSGKIRPSAVQAFLSAGSAADMPIVGKAIGALASPVANANLNDDEQQMIRAGKDFAAGVLRKESGAAVTNSELMEVMGRYFPGMFGDKPGMTEAKNRARMQYMQTMEQEAGPAINFYGRNHPKGGAPPAGGSGHEGLSDDEFARQWAAGKRKWP